VFVVLRGRRSRVCHAQSNFFERPDVVMRKATIRAADGG